MKIKFDLSFSNIVTMVAFTAFAVYEIKMKIKSGKKLLNIYTRTRKVVMSVAVIGTLFDLTDAILQLLFFRNELFATDLSAYIVLFTLIYTCANIPSLTEKGVWVIMDFMEWKQIDKVVWENISKNRKRLTIVTKTMKDEKYANVIKLKISEKSVNRIKHIFSEKQIKSEDA